MRTDDLDFELPQSLIAQRPLADRTASRLLVIRRGRAGVEHRRFAELPSLLPPSALVVLNDTRVLPARLVGARPGGGRAELLLLSPEPGPSSSSSRARWRALGRPAKRLASLGRLSFGDVLEARIVLREADGTLLVELEARDGLEIDEALELVGHVPLPPYIERDDEPDDRERYQTVFARTRGAVAAPTAGLHFTRELLASLRARGHDLAYVTLHVGAGTFAPVRSADLDEHPMHAERFVVPEPTASAVSQARARGQAVIAVGTTVVRALESATSPEGACRPTGGFVETRLLVQPGYRFRAVDGLITNFHLPRSTLLALVMALAGADVVRAAYAEAVRSSYRFFSYGDAMLVLP